MHLGRPLLLGHRQFPRAARQSTTPCRHSSSQRQHSVTVRNSWFGGGESKEGAARKALQGLGSKQPPKQPPKQSPKPADSKPAAKPTDSKVPPTTPAFSSPISGASKPAGSSSPTNPLDSLKNVFSGFGGKGAGSGAGGGRPGGGGGGGGGGFSGFGAAAGGGDELEKPILQELQELFYGIWMVSWNAAFFLAVACWLHRTLSWCIDVELLFLIGAPQQAFEKVASLFFDYVEAFEKHVLGWELPPEQQFMTAHEEIAHFFPREHAYTFDGYRYPMTAAEKDTLLNAHALHYWERPDGFPGDTDFTEVQRIKDKYEPMEADRREWRAAKAAGKLDEYWATHRHVWEEIVGSPVTLREPKPAAAAAATAAAAGAATPTNA